jgi:hypothetical protein
MILHLIKLSLYVLRVSDWYEKICLNDDNFYILSRFCKV